ncbi:DCC1-like thiol-disulfide oxidoreductase family protein [Nocardioides sp.]|uniref:DCC1-like thiol-disulfide oxidoreductase family protein n=1 Tax=Nocardioides sp. TaxID=35761 RepID=UPI003529C749
MVLTVLFDPDCPLCSAFRTRLAAEPQLVPLRFVPAGSAQARAEFPALDHARTLKEITVVGDRGEVWTHERAWVVCLWATVRHRALAERLAEPHLIGLTKVIASAAAGLRELLPRSSEGGSGAAPSPSGGGYADGCAGPQCVAP